MSNIISAFPIMGGIQVHRQLSETGLMAELVFPGDDGWDEALAAAGHFSDADQVAPPSLDHLRNHASLPRAEFLLRCVRMEILSQADAIKAALGQLPDAFALLVSEWSPADRFEVTLRWAALSQVERNHPLILSLADQIGISPETLDILFGLATGEPQA